MRKFVLCFLFITACLIKSFANDGSYFASGNQLIPVFETDVAIKKEILTLKKIRNQFIEVTVYYEFYNPKDEKEIAFPEECPQHYLTSMVSCVATPRMVCSHHFPFLSYFHVCSYAG